MTLTIDPTVFLKSSIARETREFNQNTISQLMETGDMWMVPASKIRQDRKEGKGIFPIEPDLSPLFAQLHGLPPALFSVGTQDLLLDDSLLMATRWHAVNSNARLDVSPGGCHVFQSFPELAIARQSNARIDKFLIESSEMSP